MSNFCIILSFQKFVIKIILDLRQAIVQILHDKQLLLLRQTIIVYCLTNNNSSLVVLVT